MRLRLAVVAGLLLAAAVVEAKSPLVGRVAPGFSRTALNGQTVRLEALRGRVVLLNFWATWCGPCLVEMPQFEQWQKDMPGLRVVGVAMNESGEEDAVRAAVGKLGVEYPVAMGDAELGRVYGGAFGLPVSVVIDRRGVVRYWHRGAVDLGLLKSEVMGLVGRERVAGER